MTLTPSSAPSSAPPSAAPSDRRPDTAAPDRFRLHRAGVLNVWQYDDQEFTLADGRMLLRGVNGAGKSKTLEMLLPFAIDGDKARITASAKHHTSLLWLMTDGYEGQARVGYLWVEFSRPGAGSGDSGGHGDPEVLTCGVGIRASASARTATAWYFVTGQRVGRDLRLEDDGGPLSRPRLEEAIGAAGQVFTQAAAYKEHVGRTLFGLDPAQYDDVLRLLYWLRQPQVGEDIEPARLAGQLAQALPQLDEHAVKAAGDTFDELTAYGEQIERRAAAAEALTGLADAYAAYARSALAERGRALLAAVREERRLRTALRRSERRLEELAERRDRTQGELREARAATEQTQARIRELEDSPEARDQRRLADLADLVAEQRRAADESAARLTAAEDAVSRRGAATAAQAGDLVARLGGHRDQGRELDARQRDAGVGAPVAAPVVLDVGRLDSPQRAGEVAADAGTWAEALVEARSAAGRRLATVRVVGEALDQLEEARRRQREADRAAEEAERRWEDARARHAAARAEQQERARELAEQLAAWSAEEGAPPVALPAPDRADELTPERVAALPDLAREAAAPELADLRATQEATAATRDRARERLSDLRATREAVEAERDPAPPGPALPRTDRPDGRGLWQLVDFADQVPASERAGLEAALQASGMLDAWVRPGGLLLDPATHDVVLAAPAPLPGDGPPGLDGSEGADGSDQDGSGGGRVVRTAADVLRPDLPEPSPGEADRPVGADDVGRVLRAIRLTDPGEHGDPVASIGPDGGWRLGPLHGRAAKERAQFIGATARAEERGRRLAALDEQIAEQQRILDEALAAARAQAQRIERLEAWVRGVPRGDQLRAAWTRTDERREAEDRDVEANRRAQEAAHRAREEAARLRAAAERLAAQHDVPLAREGLDALTERLRGLDHDLGRLVDALALLGREVERWADDARELARAEAELAEQRGQARRLADAAATHESGLAELRAAVGASVRELEERLGALRGDREQHRARATEAEETLLRVSGEVGSATTEVDQATAAAAGHAEARARALQGLEAVAAVPGLLEAGLEPGAEPSAETSAETGAGAGAGASAAAVHGLGALPNDQPVPGEALALAEAVQGLSGDGPDPSRVWLAYQEAASGPGADHEPTVATYADLLAVTGRDDAGEAPVAALAARVSAAVLRDRELLTDRERERFEQHVLGELGDAIRRCRLEAEELVDAMNQLLGGVTTSQGIRVRLDWRLREDVPPEAREAVRLLGQPVGALLPEERSSLRDALHRLIEASRAERPELAYGEHLAVALDYRAWSAFRIRYTRPESAGAWADLHRRSPLSQGEQKILCYLPLFAAAAAHFSSLAGAAPHAPRLVLLDDAFPKIDVRTHPLLFGLLVQLDLDFVITSERLWGDHDTVPSLAIYEALRDPGQRGIAQYEYRWDGRALHSLG